MTFCSRLSAAAHEALAGTGVRGQAYVFAPVAKALWHSNELNAGWASPQEIAAIQAARKSGVVTRLYNPPKDSSAAAKVLVYTAPEAPPAPGLPRLLEQLTKRWPVDAEPSPRLAICTHGTRDRCCAKFGFAAYSAARALFLQGASPFEPIECSHLGGDRFAATGILFPSGSMYAHLDAADLTALTDAEAAGRIAPEPYRGRVFDPPLTQIVRAGLARDGLFNDAAAPLTVAPEDHGGARVALPGGRILSVSLTQAQVRFYGSCASLAEGRTSTVTRTVYAGARDVEPAP